jgi:hypothetical protein
MNLMHTHKKQIPVKIMKKFMLCLLGIAALIGNATAVEPKAAWMEGAVGVGWRFGTSQSEIEAWNVTTLVNQVKTIPGVRYVLFNLSQAAHGDQYIAPHSVLTTLNPGSTPVTRDLFMEAATAFQNEGYKVVVYVATQGPPMLKHGVQYAWDSVEIEPGVYTSQSMDNWEGYVQSVYGNTTRDTYKRAFAEIIVDEYAERYGTLIDGWWFDNGPDSMNAPLLHDIVTTYNADVAIAFNGSSNENDFINGHPAVLTKNLVSDDINETKMLLPIEASTDGYIVQADGQKALGHMFMAAHERWNSGSIVWTVDKAADWVERCTQAGGAWTWNVDVSPGASNLRADTVTLMQDVQAQIAANATNNAPVFAADVFDGGEVDSFFAYSATVAGLATDAEGDPLRFHKIGGPAWLTVSTEGTLSGTASTGDSGMNRFKILVSDGKGNVDIADLEISVNYAFITNGVKNTSRFKPEDIDSGNWVTRDAAWSAASATLLNPGLVTDDEKGAHQINSVDISDTSLTEITVSFDYSVGVGSTLYFYSSLFTGELTNDFLLARLTRTAGTWYADDFNADITSFGGFSGPDYNLKDGSTPSGFTDGALASFVGGTSGTFSQTFDVSGFGGGGFSMADVSHVMAVFTADTAAAGDGAISIDNFKMAIDLNGPDVFTLAYTAGPNGSINGSSSQLVEKAADGSAVTAIPDPGYHFVNWSDGLTVNPRIDSNVTAEINVTANFEIDTFTLSYTAGPNGSISGPSSQVVEYGSGGSAVTAVADPGYHFIDWSDLSTDNPRTDTGVMGNVAVTANFEVDPPLSDLAGAEFTLLGTISAGTITDTYTSDNTYQILTEIESGGKRNRRRSQLEHKWVFDVTGGELVTFFVEAHHTANAEGDDFLFSYSTDDINYTEMLTVTKTEDDDSSNFFVLPGDLSGTVYVRVVDTDRTQGNKILDSLYVDSLFIVSETATEAPTGATEPSPADGAVNVPANAVLGWTPSLLAASCNVYFGVNPEPGADEFQGNQVTNSYTPGALAADTTYYWAIDEVNGAGTAQGPVWSFTTGGAIPEMHVSSIQPRVQRAGKSYRGVVTVTIIDSTSGQPVVGATVQGDFSGVFNQSLSAVTDSSGRAVLSSSSKERLPFSYTFTVTGVSATGYLYQAANNIETSDSGGF